MKVGDYLRRLQVKFLSWYCRTFRGTVYFDDELVRIAIGDPKAREEINRELAKHALGCGRVAVSWNTDWVNKVAALKGDERRLEIERGVKSFIKSFADVEREARTLQDPPKSVSEIPADVGAMLMNCRI